MRTRRLAVLVLSLALVAPGGASAAVTGPEPSREPAASFWGWLTALWAENGCHLDPDGCAGAQGDNGCRADPNGCATEDPSLDNGCHADPDGCAGAADSGDNGCRIDPSGGACRDRS
ncbi:MAG TPA: hypothetical protein VF756_28935 [Thermoanaerobaculia bacterium]